MELFRIGPAVAPCSDSRSKSWWAATSGFVSEEPNITYKGNLYLNPVLPHVIGPQHGPNDTYGCTGFQPEPPSDETADTLEEKRYRMENIYKQEGLNGGKRAEVINLMEKTYSLQRAHVNAMPASSIEDLRINWPYLFTQCGIYAHFVLLTDVKVMQVLELSIEECGQVIVEYFRTQSSHHGVQAIVSQGLDGDLTFHVVQLLMAHFGESTDGLMIFADVSIHH
ncbi:hypothetical protein GOODEAATRI_014017 [Goodea atripinnis]|uniref:Uncharacterized protein n=1 Tax=Goodea atripinnis TaxID=208336 RepID=A0ABV0PNE7_9TELE